MKQAVPLSRFIVFFSLAALCCALDLATKNWMFAPDRLGLPGENSVWWIWRDVFGFETSLNEGALFGMGGGLWPVFAALSIAAAVGIVVWLFAAGAARDWLLTVAMGFVTGGICGNLYDRLGLHGLVWPTHYPGHEAGGPIHAVRDFILVMLGSYRWPTFNLADSSLVCGAILLVWHAFFSKTEASENT